MSDDLVRAAESGDKLLSVKAAGELMGLSRWSVYRLLARELVKVGPRSYKVPRSAVVRYLDKLNGGATP